MFNLFFTQQPLFVIKLSGPGWQMLFFLFLYGDFKPIFLPSRGEEVETTYSFFFLSYFYWGIYNTYTVKFTNPKPIAQCSTISATHWGKYKALSSAQKERAYSFFFFLGLHLQCMEVPRLGVELELQLPAYTTATAMPDLNHICDLHHSSWQHGILNPLSKARDPTCILMEIKPTSSWILVGFVTAEP